MWSWWCFCALLYGHSKIKSIYLTLILRPSAAIHPHLREHPSHIYPTSIHPLEMRSAHGGVGVYVFSIQKKKKFIYTSTPFLGEHLLAWMCGWVQDVCRMLISVLS